MRTLLPLLLGLPLAVTACDSSAVDSDLDDSAGGKADIIGKPTELVLSRDLRPVDVVPRFVPGEPVVQPGRDDPAV